MRAQSPWSSRRPCTALLGSGAAHAAETRSLFTFGKGWQRVPSTCAGGGHHWPGPSCLASPRQAPTRPPPASSPAGTAILSPMGRARYPDGGTSGLLTDDFSPFSRTSSLPRPLQGPSSSPCVPSSAQRQVRAVGSRRAPLSSSRGGSPSTIPEGKPAHGSPPREWDEGSCCSNPQQRRPCPASCSRAAGPEPVLGTVALGPAEGPVLGAPGLEPGSWWVRTIGYG